MARNLWWLGARTCIHTALFAFLLAGPAQVAAQQTSNSSPAQEDPGAGETKAGTDDREAEDSGLEAMAADTDPTKPVIFSFRNEFYDLKQGLWKNVNIFRADKAVLEKTELPGRTRGFILRADVPVVTFYNGDDTEAGLGDMYGQALCAPRIRGPFFLAVGTGLVLPTADYNLGLGLGKYIIAPAVVPVVFIPRRGLAYVKIQDWVSFAGKSVPLDVHYLTITPRILWRLSKRWWMLVDEESLTDWEKGSKTNYKAGFLVGFMLTRRMGISVQAEIPFGAYRQGDWTIKTLFFRTKY